MLSLDSPRWSELRHAYGPASDTPGLLQQLALVPESGGETEPWFALWSSLAHQGDVYPATFAAVPYVVQALASAPLKADFSYFQFPAWVEICRQKNGTSIPEDLAQAYFDSLSRLPELAAAAAARDWDENFLPCVLAAIAVSKGQAAVAEASLELTTEVAKEFMQWFWER